MSLGGISLTLVLHVQPHWQFLKLYWQTVLIHL
jgi:hypothetical protein